MWKTIAVCVLTMLHELGLLAFMFSTYYLYAWMRYGQVGRAHGLVTHRPRFKNVMLQAQEQLPGPPWQPAGGGETYEHQGKPSMHWKWHHHFTSDMGRSGIGTKTRWWKLFPAQSLPKYPERSALPEMWWQVLEVTSAMTSLPYQARPSPIVSNCSTSQLIGSEGQPLGTEDPSSPVAAWQPWLAEIHVLALQTNGLFCNQRLYLFHLTCSRSIWVSC